MKSSTIARPEAERVLHEACEPAPASRGQAFPTSKRVLDVTLATLLIVLTLPVMLVAAALVRLTSPGPVLFRQTRIGLNERPFTMLKLRTMHVDCDDARHREYTIRELTGTLPKEGFDGLFKPADDPRITKVGRFLRRFSIDEIPQLINVLRNEMSLVGPRPSLPWEVELYTPEQRRRHDCLPGMTGLWQVSGRNRLTMADMLALDVAYVESRSLGLDLWILLRTPFVIFRNEAR